MNSPPPAAPPADAGAWSRPRPRRRERQVDLAIAGALFIAAVLSQQLYRIAGVYEDPADGPLTIGLLALETLPLALRRSHPVRAAIIVGAAFVGIGFLQVPELLVSNIALFTAIYSVGAWVADRNRALLVRGVIVATMGVSLTVSVYLAATNPEVIAEFPTAGAFSPLVAYLSIQVLVNVLYFAGAWWFGNRAYAAAQQHGLLEQRTEELERERERTAAQAVALDRVRIARELHDAVAHHVSVIGVQAGAARVVLQSDPAAAASALQVIENTSRETISELHSMLTTLRDSDETGETSGSAPDLDQLDALITASRNAGVPTELRIVGEPHGVPAIASVNLYRIAQEALTNVRKHAGPDATADVRLRYGGDHVELEVANTGAAAPRRVPGGLGQLGMRERVEASGGTLELGPRSRGGYLVRARVPLPEVHA